MGGGVVRERKSLSVDEEGLMGWGSRGVDCLGREGEVGYSGRADG